MILSSPTTYPLAQFAFEIYQWQYDEIAGF
jgi:hypothetical protein